jgi:fatty-acyl-CoA synthase
MTTFICGAEPVLPKTMESFVQHFQKARLRAGAMVPAYGLAEATLAVTFTPYMRGLATDEVNLESLSAGYAKPAVADRTHIRISSCGVPMPELYVRIASESNSPLPDRRIGEIQIKGPTVTPAYVGDEEATRNAKTPDGWIRSGDLGYFAGGELYVCGRIKDVIIIRGKNFHAHDLESLASDVPGVRTGNVVAFSVQREEGESFVIVAETRSEERSSEISRQIRSRLAESIGIAPDDVVLVPAGTLPKTSSGKLKRSETRQRYLSSTLQSKQNNLSAIRAAFQSGAAFLRRKLR